MLLCQTLKLVGSILDKKLSSLYAHNSQFSVMFSVFSQLFYKKGQLNFTPQTIRLTYW